MEQPGSHWTDFDKTWYLTLFKNLWRKSKFILKSDKNNGFFIWRRFDIYDNISLNSSYNNEYFRQIYRKNQNIWCSAMFCIKSCCLWENIEKKKYGGARGTTNDITIWLIWVACWISKATCTHAYAHTPGHKHARPSGQITHKYKQYLLLFQDKNDSRKRLNLTLYVQCLSCLFLIWIIRKLQDLLCSRLIHKQLCYTDFCIKEKYIMFLRTTL
jgi:hypothetical protein